MTLNEYMTSIFRWSSPVAIFYYAVWSINQLPVIWSVHCFANSLQWDVYAIHSGHATLQIQTHYAKQLLCYPKYRCDEFFYHLATSRQCYSSFKMSARDLSFGTWCPGHFHSQIGCSWLFFLAWVFQQIWCLDKATFPDIQSTKTPYSQTNLHSTQINFQNSNIVIPLILVMLTDITTTSWANVVDLRFVWN